MRRVRLVSLTAEGRDVTARATKEHARIVSTAMAAISAQEAETVRHAMIKITATLAPDHPLALSRIDAQVS